MILHHQMEAMGVQLMQEVTLLGVEPRMMENKGVIDYQGEDVAS